MSMTREEASRILAYLKDNSCSKAERVAMNMALTALRGPTREMVERMRGEWKHTHSSNAFFVEAWVCSYCGFEEGNGECFNFCPECGQPKTDKAVDMMVERWKEALDNDN